VPGERETTFLLAATAASQEKGANITVEKKENKKTRGETEGRTNASSRTRGMRRREGSEHPLVALKKKTSWTGKASMSLLLKVSRMKQRRSISLERADKISYGSCVDCDRTGSVIKKT